MKSSNSTSLRSNSIAKYDIARSGVVSSESPSAIFAVSDLRADQSLLGVYRKDTAVRINLHIIFWNLIKVVDVGLLRCDDG